MKWASPKIQKFRLKDYVADDGSKNRIAVWTAQVT